MKFIFALLALLVLAVQSEFHDEVHEIEQQNFVAAIKYKKKGSTGLFGYINDWWSSGSKQHTCTATIVSNDKIVTAGRCVFDTETVTLIVGSTNTEEPYQKFEVTEDEIHVHPEFSMLPPYINDVAVIQLKKPLQFNSKVGKIDLVEKNYREKDDDRMTAFGYRESTGRHRTHADTNLYKIGTRVWIFDECQHLYSEQTFGMKHSHVLDHEFQFCFRLLEGEYSALGRYIGGPVLTKDNKFIGIVSHYIDGLPQVCTLASAYENFINNPQSYSKNKFQKSKAWPSKKTTIWTKFLSGLKKENKSKKSENKSVDTKNNAAEIVPSLSDQMRWAEMYDEAKSEESRLHAELDALKEKYNKITGENQKLIATKNQKNDASTQIISNGVSVGTQTHSTSSMKGHDKSTQTSPITMIDSKEGMKKRKIL